MKEIPGFRQRLQQAKEKSGASRMARVLHREDLVLSGPERTAIQAMNLFEDIWTESLNSGQVEGQLDIELQRRASLVFFSPARRSSAAKIKELTRLIVNG